MNHSYKANGLFKNGHFNTLYTYFMRKVEDLPYTREKLLPAHGFALYMDWLRAGNNKLLIISHGLESSSHAKYVRGMAKLFFANSFDVMAWNNRGCAVGEKIEDRAAYHSGLTEDLRHIVDHVLSTTDYKEIYLIGFSMGGNITLKYLGETGESLDSRIVRAIAISTPVDLLSSSYSLASLACKPYAENFLMTLRKKVRDHRHILIEEGIDPDVLLKCKNLREFDHHFTARFWGFESGDDYYRKASARPYMSKITIPTLLINAKDDPFLGPGCFPSDEDIGNSLIQLLYTESGGHVGYHTKSKDGVLWTEEKALEFFQK